MRVQIAEPGSTPRKEQQFNIMSPPMNVGRASPERAGLAVPTALKTTPKRDAAQQRRRSLKDYDESESVERPKTSRHIPNPSPEKFASYIIQSPTKENGTEVLSFEEGGTRQNNVPFTFAYESDDYESEDIDTDTGSMPRRKLSADAREWTPANQTKTPVQQDNPSEIGRFLLFVALSS